MTPHINPRHLTYQVRWSDEDQEYVGTCRELPSLSHLDSTPTAALHGIIGVVGMATEDFTAEEWAALKTRAEVV